MSEGKDSVKVPREMKDLTSRFIACSEGPSLRKRYNLLIAWDYLSDYILGTSEDRQIHFLEGLRHSVLVDDTFFVFYAKLTAKLQYSLRIRRQMTYSASAPSPSCSISDTGRSIQPQTRPLCSCGPVSRRSSSCTSLIQLIMRRITKDSTSLYRLLEL